MPRYRAAPVDASAFASRCSRNRGSLGKPDRLVDAHRLEPLAEYGAVLGDGTAGCFEHVDRTLRLLRVERRADDLPLAAPKILGALVAGGNDARLHLAGNQAVQDSAFGLDQAELVPC